MVGEIGGDEEEKAAAFIEAELTKPVVAYIAGFTAPPGKTMGHAGAIISGSSGTAEGKKAALEAKGIRVGTTPTRDRRARRRDRPGLSSRSWRRGQQLGQTMASGAVDFSGLPQLSVAERVARGQGGAARGAAVEPRRLRARAAPARPGRAARAAGRDARARARADPLRADARLAVHVLPRRGADHGGRPGRDAALRA